MNFRPLPHEHGSLRPRCGDIKGDFTIPCGRSQATRLLDVVALLSGVPAHGLLRGQAGTVVELLEGACEVEFSDNEGRTYAELALTADQLLVLHHQQQRDE